MNYYISPDSVSRISLGNLNFMVILKVQYELLVIIRN